MMSNRDLRPVLTQLDMHCNALPASLDRDSLKRLQVFYDHLDGLPAWQNDAHLQQLEEQLAQLADDGLNPDDYRRARSASSTTPPECADVLTSHAYLLALLHLRRGRIAIPKDESLWRPAGWVTADGELAALSLALAHLNQPADAFARARPDSARYQLLRKAYAAQRLLPVVQWPSVPEGKLLKSGGADHRLPQLRARLEAEGYLSPSVAGSGTIYDSATQQALEKFQSAHGLNPDGVLGPASIKELNISAGQRRGQLRANLERLRWLADDLRASEVLINLPASELEIIRNAQVQWRTRTQVGRHDRQTPLLLSSLNRLSLNPTWTVPPTILRKDKLPAIRNDIGYLSRNGLRVLDRNGAPLDPYDVNWDNPGSIMLRQSAGSHNPLGRVAFRFDNPFAVYLHDTPSQSLFSKAPRAFSSGCVRVEHIDEFFSWILTPEELPNVLKRVASGKTQQYRMQQPLIVLLAYWTAEARADGSLTYYPDIYGRDEYLISQLDAAR